MNLTIASSVALERSFTGEIAALTAAFLWAVATLMFGQIGRQLAPVVLNLVKGIFAIALILITLLLRYQLSNISLTLTPSDTLYLLLSGGIGIGLGDTAYFAAINALGARRALLLETLAPPVATLLAWAFLGEQISALSAVGIGLTLLGILFVITETSPGTSSEKISPYKISRHGLGAALIAVICQAAGAVLSRGVLAETSIDPLLSALLRLLAGMVFMGALVLIQPSQLGNYGSFERSASESKKPFNSDEPQQKIWQQRWSRSLAALKQPSLLFSVGMAAFFGTYLGIWLQQVSLKYTAAGIAQALLATSPLFVLPLAAMVGDRITYRAVIGAAIALSGVWILIAG